MLMSLVGFQNARSLTTSPSIASAQKPLEKHLEFQPTINNKTARGESLELSAHSAILIDQNSGQVLYAKNSHDSLPPASVIKMLTAVVALESGDYTRPLSVSARDASVEPNIMGLKGGERVPVRDLIYGLFMISANDAAETLADGSYPKRGEFIGQMNRLAQSLGLNETQISNPSGLDDGKTKSSAFDLATITRYALKKEPLIREAWSTKSKTISGDNNHGPYYLYNISDLIDIYPGLNGVKTGYTEDAGHTLIASASRGSKNLLLVYMNSNQGIQDATVLFDYGFSK
jgi:serine-type D-Ala-D-Ala carboxypeptidase (penicillin-binding protein 5/6)